MRILKVVVGATVGVVLGSVLAFLAVVWEVRRTLPPGFQGQVGIRPPYMLRDPIFWTVFLFTVIGSAYLVGRRKRSPML